MIQFQLKNKCSFGFPSNWDALYVLIHSCILIHPHLTVNILALDSRPIIMIIRTTIQPPNTQLYVFNAI